MCLHGTIGCTTSQTCQHVSVRMREYLQMLFFCVCLCACGCSVGGAAFCLDYAWQYANERRQFGQPVGAFQASQVRNFLIIII